MDKRYTWEAIEQRLRARLIPKRTSPFQETTRVIKEAIKRRVGK